MLRNGIAGRRVGLERLPLGGVVSFLRAFDERRDYILFFCSLASSLIALPPCSTSLPAPSMVLQPVSVPKTPAKNTVARSATKILLIMIDFLSKMQI
jgi:hypothetical protein